MLFAQRLANAAADGQATGPIIIFIGARRISGVLATFDEWLDGMRTHLGDNNADRAPQDNEEDEEPERFFLRDAHDSDGTPLGWFTCPSEDVRAIGLPPIKSAHAQE